MIDKKGIADNIINSLSKSIPGADISLRGSVFSGQDDDLSDVDILVQHNNLTDRNVADLVVKCLNNNNHIVFEDWAKGFLPKECVITFFIEGLPIHCFVEIAIIVPEDNRELSPNQVTQKYPDHFIKMWVIAHKKFRRGLENFELDYLTNLTLKQKVDEIGSQQDALKKVFHSISEDTKRKYPSIYEGCIKYIEQID